MQVIHASQSRKTTPGSNATSQADGINASFRQETPYIHKTPKANRLVGAWTGLTIKLWSVPAGVARSTGRIRMAQARDERKGKSVGQNQDRQIWGRDCFGSHGLAMWQRSDGLETHLRQTRIKVLFRAWIRARLVGVSHVGAPHTPPALFL